MNCDFTSNGIPVISGRWEVDKGRLCAMEFRLWLRIFCLERESNSVRLISRPELNTLSYRGSFNLKNERKENFTYNGI